jgi:hypothetical protein
MSIVDLSGQKFGRLTVLRFIRAQRKGKGSGTFWLCKCDCGSKKEVRSNNLRRGIAKSCGCLNKELFIKRSTQHGKTGTRTHRIWAGMKLRCDTPTCNIFQFYGAKGISYDSRWKEFEAFYDDMGECPSSKHSLDRIDGSKHYSKENCRWATSVEQSNNIKTNRYLTFEGRTLTIAQWGRDKNIPAGTIKTRLRVGWTIERALTEKVGTSLGINQFSQKS